MHIPKDSEMLETLRDVVNRLDSLGIAYMVTGSFAMSLYVTARTTMDIDIVLDISGEDAPRIAEIFKGGYYVDAHSIRRAILSGSMFNMLDLSTGVKVDCIVRKHEVFENERFERRRKSTLGDIPFWSIGKSDLILSKLRWAKDSRSERQFEDIRRLLESESDDQALLPQIEQLGLTTIWEAFEAWKIQAGK